MNVVAKSIKVELEDDEQVVFSKARDILKKFLDTMEDKHCLNACFEEYGLVEYSFSEIQKTFDIIDMLSDESPTIE